MEFLDIDCRKPNLELLKAALDLLEKDYPIVFPTDTVYGILIKYSEPNAQKLHALRRADLSKPFLAVISEDFNLKQLVDRTKLKPSAENFLDAHWPGKVTCILPKHPSLRYPSGDTIAIRMCAHLDNTAFHTLVQMADFPLLAPSLNRAGEPLIATKGAARASFSNDLEYAFWDEHFSSHNQPSQIWDLTGSEAVQVR